MKNRHHKLQDKDRLRCRIDCGPPLKKRRNARIISYQRLIYYVPAVKDRESNTAATSTSALVERYNLCMVTAVLSRVAYMTIRTTFPPSPVTWTSMSQAYLYLMRWSGTQTVLRTNKGCANGREKITTNTYSIWACATWNWSLIMM